MTMKLELTADVQEGLMAQAQENGLSLEAFAKQVLAERSREGLRTREAHELSSEERLQAFDAWVKSQAENKIVLPDEAMERESIYGDHGR